MTGSMEQILEYKKALSQIDEGKNEDYGAGVDILERLEKITATKDLLLKTKIGIVVNRLSKHKHQELAHVAARVVKSWKQQTLAQPSSSPGGLSGASSPQSLSRIMSISSTASVSSVSGDKGSLTVITSALTVATDAQTIISSQPGLISPSSCPNYEEGHGMFRVGETKDDVRNKVQRGLFDALTVNAPSGGEKIEVGQAELAVRLENAMLQKYKGTAKEYRDHYRALSANLKDKANPDLTRNLYLGFLQPEAVIHMKITELASSELQKQRKQERKDAIDATRSDWDEEKAAKTQGGMFKCGKCKQSKTRHYQMQTRSADEPMTVFITCLVCGNKWRS